MASGGLSEFFSTVGKDQRAKNLIRRNLLCSSKSSQVLYRKCTGPSVWAGFHPQHGLESSAQFTTDKLFPSPCDALSQQDLQSPPSPARSILSTVPCQAFLWAGKGSPSQWVRSLDSQIKAFLLFHVLFFSAWDFQLCVLSMSEMEMTVCVSKHCIPVRHTKACSCWSQDIKELRRVHHPLLLLRESQGDDDLLLRNWHKEGQGIWVSIFLINFFFSSSE